VTGYRSVKLGTQSALISQPVKHCATQPQRLLYSTAPVRAPALYHTCVTCAVQCLHLYSACACAVPALQRASFACFIRVLHHAARCCPAPHYALYTARFGGKNRYIKRGCFWQKKDVGKKLPWELLFPPKTNFGTSPHPTGTKLKAEPYVFMYRTMA
jgi:hypothetical protein